MDAHVYKDVEKGESGWWYYGRTLSLGSILPRFVKGRGTVLDVGAGYGAMHSFLARYGEVSAFDTYPDCIDACRRRGYKSVYASLDVLTSTLEMYTLIGAFDSLEHMERDDETLRLLATKLAPEGVFVATVPAHPFLFSDYDREAHHYRRYSRRTLRALCDGAGLDVLYMSYWNGTLFFPAALARLMGGGGTKALRLHPFIEYVFRGVVYVESLLLRLMPLPIGLSLIVVARKKP
jgi:SAM-dependent methyltransferase